MELLLMRHAIALSGSAVLPDAERPLSPRGRERFAQVVVGLQRLGIRLDRLYYSPWRRAMETAALLTPVLDGEAIVSADLAGPPSRALLTDIVGQQVALVGHQPWMGELVMWLLTGSHAGGSGFAFKRGGVAWLEGQPKPGRMTLLAFLPPRVLRTLGEVRSP